MFAKGFYSLLLFVLGERHGFNDRVPKKDNYFSCNAAVPGKIASPLSTTQLNEAARTLEICVSPGCVADGANEALMKLQALSASSSSEPALDIVPGVCCSLCGNGPVAKETESGKKYRKLTTNKKLLGILSLEESDLNPNQKAALDGIDLCIEGDKALALKKYPQALQKYGQSIGIGMNAAIALSTSSGNIASLQWLLLALCNEAFCKLQTKDIDGAIVSAGTAFQLSQKKSSKALEVLQEAYQSKGDDQKELEALEQLFVLYEMEEQEKPKAKRRLPPMEANKRRTLGFRLSRLQAAVKK